jgi:hypothetical protein
MDEIVLTLSPATHDVVKVEKLGKAGQRTELSEQECAELASGDESSESGEPDPSASYLRRESVELGFIAVLQYLPGKQRDLMMARRVVEALHALRDAQVGDFSPAAWLLARESAMVRCEVDPPGLLAAERVRQKLAPRLSQLVSSVGRRHCSRVRCTGHELSCRSTMELERLDYQKCACWDWPSASTASTPVRRPTPCRPSAGRPGNPARPVGPVQGRRSDIEPDPSGLAGSTSTERGPPGHF